MTDNDINQKYRIADIPIDGKIEEICELIPYKNGNGFLRNVIVEMAGVFGTRALAPITLLGEDATELDPQLDAGRPIKCAGRISSRQYLDRTGHLRWSVSITGGGVMLGERVTARPKTDNERPAEAIEEADPLASDPDDIPF